MNRWVAGKAGAASFLCGPGGDITRVQGSRTDRDATNAPDDKPIEVPEFRAVVDHLCSGASRPDGIRDAGE
ncbi:MAG: hypothetical protein ACM30E_03625 [Nitrososphaerales archaeon]